MMTLTEKVLNALESAENHLKKSLLTFNKDEGTFADSIWHVAAELEYALFLFSLMSDGEYDKVEWKPNPESQGIEADDVLAKVMELIRESKKALANKNLIDAHKYAYTARQYIFKIQGNPAKKK